MSRVPWGRQAGPPRWFRTRSAGCSYRRKARTSSNRVGRGSSFAARLAAPTTKRNCRPRKSAARRIAVVVQLAFLVEPQCDLALVRIDASEDPGGAACNPVVGPGLAAPEPPLRRAGGLPPFLLEPFLTLVPLGCWLERLFQVEIAGASCKKQECCEGHNRANHCVLLPASGPAQGPFANVVAFFLEYHKSSIT